MLVFGLIAASDMTAGQTEAKVNPGVTHFEAFLTSLTAGRDFLDLIEMGAFALTEGGAHSATLNRQVRWCPSPPTTPCE